MFKVGKIWYFRIAGVKQSSGTSDKERAKALQRKLEQEEFDRKHGFYIPSWDEACLKWLEGHKHLDSYIQNCIYAKWWQSRLTGRKLTAITADLIHQEISKGRPITEGRSKKNSTANIYVNFAEKIIRSSSNLKPEFRKYPEPHKGKRWLRPEEWQAMKMTDDLRHICTFALATGLREGNCMAFEWTWIHGDKAYLPPEVTKTDEAYGIPLNTAALAVIEERKKAKVRHPKYLFTNGGKVWTCVMVLRLLKRAAVVSKVEPLTFHTFRHTFASWLAIAGVSDAIRCRLGCWSGGSSASSGYLHFDVDGLRPFSEKLVSIMSQSVEGNTQNQDVMSG